MSLSAIIKILLDNGVASEVIVATVEAYEKKDKEKEDIRREKTKERVRKHRELCNARNALHALHSVTSVTSLSSSSSPSSSPLVPPLSPAPLSPPLIPPTSSSSSSPISLSPEKGSRKKVQEYSEDFEKFWLAYPKARRCAKPDAFKAWKIACQVETPEKLFDSLQTYLKSKECLEGFAPFPAKWLRKERYNEEFVLKRRDYSGIML